MQDNSQPELFKAETTWFHLFKAMIDSGDLAKLSGSALKVYLVVKSYTNFSTGDAFPSMETIAKKAGVTPRQVLRALKELQGLAYISQEKIGRSNRYRLREKIEIQDEHGRPSAVASWDYLPSTVQHAVADLKNVMVTGDIGGARIVHIANLTVNIANQGGVVVNLTESTSKETREAALEQIRRIVGTGKQG
jgi:AraC-like DNA-binding protein